MGLSNHMLPDQNFNASSSLAPFKPSDARLHASNASWVDDGVENDRFLQISFQPLSKLVTAWQLRETQTTIGGLYVTIFCTA